MRDPGLEITSSALCGKCFTRSAIPAPNMVLIPCVQQKERGKKQVMLLAYNSFLLFLKTYLPAYISKVKKKCLLPTKFKNIHAHIWGPCGYTVYGCPVHNKKRKKRERKRGREGETKTQRMSFVFLSGGGVMDAEWPAVRLHSWYLLACFFSKLVF